MRQTGMDPQAHEEELKARALEQLRKPEPRILLTCAKDVQPERVEWLWEGYLPFGKIVGLDGRAGLGKSTLVMDLIARASQGGPMPYDGHTFEPVTVLIAGVEDGWGDTIRPRLDAAEADLARVHFVMPHRPDHIVTIPGDVMELIEAAKKKGAKWLHIDAIMQMLDSDVEANSDHEVRRALATLGQAASAAGILVTFIRHPRKAAALAVNAGGGSVAFTALARVQLFLGAHPEDKDGHIREARRVLAVTKANLTAQPDSLAFMVESAPNGAGRINWLGPVNVAADELANPVISRTKDEKARPKAQAVQFLEAELAEGARVPVNTLKARARKAGLAWRTVERAASQELGVTKERKGFGGGGIWSLPVEDPDEEGCETDTETSTESDSEGDSEEVDSGAIVSLPEARNKGRAILANPSIPAIPATAPIYRKAGGNGGNGAKMARMAGMGGDRGPAGNVVAGALLSPSEPARPVRVVWKNGTESNTTTADPGLSSMKHLIEAIELLDPLPETPEDAA